MKTLELSERIEVQQPDGSWVAVHLEQVESGDVIRVTSPDGSAMMDAQGRSIKMVANPMLVFSDELEVVAAGGQAVVDHNSLSTTPVTDAAQMYLDKSKSLDDIEIFGRFRAGTQRDLVIRGLPEGAYLLHCGTAAEDLRIMRMEAMSFNLVDEPEVGESAEVGGGTWPWPHGDGMKSGDELNIFAAGTGTSRFDSTVLNEGNVPKSDKLH